MSLMSLVLEARRRWPKKSSTSSCCFVFPCPSLYCVRDRFFRTRTTTTVFPSADLIHLAWICESATAGALGTVFPAKGNPCEIYDTIAIFRMAIETLLLDFLDSFFILSMQNCFLHGKCRWRTCSIPLREPPERTLQ